MATNLPYENLSPIQNGEPVSGGVGGNSDGVLNRPLVQLQANVKKVRDEHDTLSTEVVNARNGEANLDTRLDKIDSAIASVETSNIFNLEAIASMNRQRIPSCFKYDLNSVQIEETANNEATSSSSRSVGYWSLAAQLLANASSGMANKIGFRGTPAPIFVDGYPIYLEQRPDKYLSALVEFSAAPSTGTRLDYAFLEVWKEKVTFGAADDVLFPYGCVMFQGTGTADSCTLLNTNASGGNNPAYLAASGNHGYYVKANDANIQSFMANPKNNVVCDQNGDYYQIRWRIRTVAGVASANVLMAHNDTTNIKAQGMLAAPSAYSFGSVSDDIGLSKASNASLAKDGIVRAIPIGLVHRRNSTAWSLSNPNGAGAIGGTSGRPDGLFHNHIEIRDILDLRQHGMFDNNFDFESMYKSNLDKIFDCSLATSFENLMSDTDGNGTYKDLGIYGTKLLRADGIAGTLAFDASWEVIWRKTAENGITCKFDGIRNYFSDVGGDQAILGYIPNVGADGVNPTSCFTYVSSSKTFAFDATNLDSGNDLNSGNARTKVSVRKPRLVWDERVYDIPYAMQVRGVWTGLGGDSASFIISDKTPFILRGSATVSGIVIGDTYTSSNGVVCAVTGFTSNSGDVTFEYSGTTMPSMYGNFTRTTGSGNATLSDIIGTLKSVVFYVTSAASIAGIKVGDTYTGPDSNGYTVASVYPRVISFLKTTGSTAAVPNPTGTWTRTSGNGPETVTFNGTIPYSIGYGANLVYEGMGSNFVSSTAGIHVQAYATFTPGSGVLTRLPYQSADSIKATHFNVNISGTPTQVLPNNGVGFIPFGTSVDPLNDGNGPGTDSHTRQTGMVGFGYKNALLSKGATGSFTSNGVGYPSVIKDGSTYKMWFTGISTDGYYRIGYATSSDCITWSAPQMVMDVNTGGVPNSSHSAYCSVIKDGSTYKMWFSGYSGSTWSILYSTSTNGTTWTTPSVVITNGSEPNGYNAYSYYPCVIKDGSTYKMWFSGYKSDTYVRLLYSTSSDGVTWSTPVLAMNVGSDPMGFSSKYIFPCSVIKEGSIYKAIFSGYDGSITRNLVSMSADGITWSAASLVNVITSETLPQIGYIGTFIKDGPAYKAWYSSSDASGSIINFAVLSMTDSANTGSSLTGVYATQGSMNFAPPADSQVIMFYEARADQLPRNMIGNTYEVAAVYDNADLVSTTAGTGAIISTDAMPSTKRDFYTFLLQNSQDSSYLPFNAKCEEIVGNIPELNYLYYSSNNTTFGNDNSYFVISKRFAASAAAISAPSSYTLNQQYLNAGVAVTSTFATAKDQLYYYTPLSHEMLDNKRGCSFAFFMHSFGKLVCICNKAQDKTPIPNGFTKHMVALGRPVLK